MKQYKVLRVKISLEEIGKGDYKNLEMIMNDMSKDGWEVVCQSPQPGTDSTYLLVTFCKESE